MKFIAAHISWRLMAKTAGWAVISGIIFFSCAVYKGCAIEAALFATLIATISKTPAYPLWEAFFESIWKKPCDYLPPDGR